jgi:[NiFe] hydrogenase assembly HybE family chaperone
MQRVGLLVGAFERIARTRMAGVPILHAGLRTEAVGFAAQADDEGQPGLLGILITPWFMNLVWLPPTDASVQAGALPVGVSRMRPLGSEPLSFIGAEESGCRFEACSLFSPMFEFADQAGARAVAQAVLQALRQPQAAAQAAAPALAAPVAPAGVDAPRPPPALPGAPTRRGLLFGRRTKEPAR